MAPISDPVCVPDPDTDPYEEDVVYNVVSNPVLEFTDNFFQTFGGAGDMQLLNFPGANNVPLGSLDIRGNKVYRVYRVTVVVLHYLLSTSKQKSHQTPYTKTQLSNLCQQMVVQNHHGHPVGSCGSKSTEMRPCTTTFLHTAPKGRAQIAAGASALLCPPAAVIDTSYMDGKLAPRNKVKVVGGFCNKVRKDIFKYVSFIS